jgi:glycosyltransferase involved in cell wall biosynthesis
MKTLLEAAGEGRDPEAVLAAQDRALVRLECAAERAHDAGRVEEAIGIAEFAAWVASMNHPGRLASPRLEAMLHEISREHVAKRVPSPAQSPERVLIVATEAYEVGAHTRLIRRWVARDPDRRYTVVLTRQRSAMPAVLEGELAAGGGRLVALNPDLGALARADQLRALAVDADLIATLDHPHDPLPTVAFSAMAGRPPAVMMNHGDHLFWLGRTIVDVLMCTRGAGVRFAERRGFPGPRIMRTPFPVSGPDGHGRDAGEPLDAAERAACRRELRTRCGWSQDATVMITVGTSYKYEGAPGLRLLDEVRVLLEEDRDVCMVAAGPDDQGQWLEARQQYSDRVLALGALPTGVERLLAGADIYLESRPFGGAGACAEAAAAGLPVISAAITEDELTSVFTDAEYAAAYTDGGSGYAAALRRLVRDPGVRAQLGEHARQQVAAIDTAWEAALEATYQLARSLGRISQGELSTLPPAGTPDILVDFANQANRRLHPEELERLVELAEVASMIHSPMPLLEPPEAGRMRQVSRFSIIFAALDRPDAARLRAIVDVLRQLRRTVAPSRCVLALRPEEADDAVPVLEEAIATGEDVDVELLLDPMPVSLRPPGSLQIIGPDDVEPTTPFYVSMRLSG